MKFLTCPDAGTTTVSTRRRRAGRCGVLPSVLYLLFSVLLLVSMPGIPSQSASAASPPDNQVVFLSGGKLHLVTMPGDVPVTVPTPFPVQNVYASPDGQRFAITGNKGQTAVLRLTLDATAPHVTWLPSGPWKACCPLLNQWSPNGRYLAFLRGNNSENFAELWVWDSWTGRSRRILSDLALTFSSQAWSPDSTRLALSAGRTNSMTTPVTNPRIVIADIARGTTRILGKGADLAWSPDGRLLSYTLFQNCGASECWGSQRILPSSGGNPIVLNNNSEEDFVNTQWRTRPGGYIFDRWLLDIHGRSVGMVTSGKERIASWSPDGLRAAIQTVHPYAAGTFSLRIQTTAGARTPLYTTAASDSCGACSRVQFQAVWDRTGSRLAFVVPPIYKASGKVIPGKVLLYRRGAVQSVPIPGANNYNLIGFANSGQDLVAVSNNTLYRYHLSNGSVHLLARGVGLVQFPGSLRL